VGECFFWYRLTWVVPDKFHRAVKRLCACVCVSEASSSDINNYKSTMQQSTRNNRSQHGMTVAHEMCHVGEGMVDQEKERLAIIRC